MPRISAARLLARTASLAAGTLTVLASTASLAGDVSLAWDPVAGSAGYELQYGTSPGSYSEVVDTGQTARVTVSGLEAGETYYAAVRAYRAGQSDFSAFSSELLFVFEDATAPAPVASFSLSPESGDAPLAVTFADTSTNISAGASRLWRFPDGGTSTSSSPSRTFSTAGQYDVSLTVTAADGRASVATRTVNVTSPLPPPPPPPIDPPDAVPMATASIEVDNSWQSVEFGREFTKPVLVLGPPVGSSVPAVVRVAHIKGTGFRVRLTAIDADETATPATVSYVVVERGEYTLGDGRQLVADHFRGVTEAATSWRASRRTFRASFDAAPVLIASLGRANGREPRLLRLDDVGRTGFDYRLDTPEGSRYARGVDRVDYIAMDAGAGRFGGLTYLAGITPADVEDEDYSLDFATAFDAEPTFIASAVTTNDRDAAALNATAVDSFGASVYLGEERSADEETARSAGESVAYLAIGQTSSDEEEPVPAPAPSDAPAVAAEYLFEGGDGADTGGRGQDLALRQGASVGAGRSGRVLVLDGVDDFAVLADAAHVGAMPSRSTEPSSSFSVTAWIRPDTLNGRKPIASKQSKLVAGPRRGFLFTTGEKESNSEGQLFLQVFSSDSTKNEVAGTQKVVAGRWQHVAATYEFRGNGQSRIRLYLNGVRVGRSDTAIGPVQANRQSLHIGAYRWSSTYQRFFDGMMDDVRVHRRALTSGEVQALAGATGG